MEFQKIVLDSTKLKIVWIKKKKFFKQHSFKKCCFFIPTILSFMLPRKIIDIYTDIARKYGNVTVKAFREYKELECKTIN